MECSFIVFVMIMSRSCVQAQKSLTVGYLASQSSDYSYSYTASRVNYGDANHIGRSYSCSRTQSGSFEWFMMEWKEPTMYYISRVQIYFVNDPSYTFYNREFSLYVSNTSISGTHKQTPPGYLCYKDPAPGPPIYSDIECNMVGTKIIIVAGRYPFILYICHLEILGCPKGWFGYNCGTSCLNKCFVRQCFLDFEGCISDFNCKDDICDGTPTCFDCKEGCTGLYCNESCPERWFGKHCKTPCSGKCFGQQCFPSNGSCIHGCNCEICDSAETCIGGCKEGWTGQYCNEPIEAECHSFPRVAVVEDFALIKVVCLGYDTLPEDSTVINYSITNLPEINSDNAVANLSNILGIFDNLTFSIGQPNHNFTHSFAVLIEAYIYGIRYYSINSTVQVEVTSTKGFTDHLYNLIHHNSSYSSDIKTAFDYMTDPLDVINADEHSTKIDIKVCEVISEALEQIQVENIQEIGMMTNVLNKLLLKPDRLTEKATNSVMDTLTKTSALVINSNLTEDSEADVLPILENIMDASSSVFDINVEEPTQSSKDGNETHLKDDSKVIAKKTMIKKILHIIDNVGNSMLQLISNKTKTIVFETKAMNLMVGIMDDRNNTEIKSSRTLNGKFLQGSFQLPNMSNVLDGSNEEFSYQMLFSDKNPFQWDESAKNITTPMISLKINDINRNPLKVKNFKEPVIIEIPIADDDKFSIFSSTIYPNSSISDRILRLRVIPWVNNAFMMKIKINATTNHFVTRFAIKMTEKVSKWDVLNGTVTNGTEFKFLKDASETAVSWSVGILPVFLENETSPILENETSPILGNESSPITVTYWIESSVVSCQYWDVVREKWSKDGCKVASQTLEIEGLECECSHLTDFAGGFFVVPNLVDPIEDILLFLTFFENPVVVTTVIVLWCLYFISFYWSRKADNKDASMTGIIIPFQSSLHDKYKYMICVVTGWRHRGGTTAKVSCFIVGTNGTSAKQCLSVPGRVLFQTGSEDWFLITSSHNLGEINMIVIWHDNDGYSPSWYLSSITIDDLHTKQKSYFWCEKWLGIEGDQAKIALHRISYDELKTKSGSQFLMRTMRDLRQNHFLLSIVSKTTSSDFTRVQRLSCAMCLLLCSMLTCLMFHGIPTDDAISEEVSGIKFELSLKDIIIGIESAFIMIPINLIIMALFLKTKPRVSRKDVYIKQLDEEVNRDTQNSLNDKEKHPSTSSKIFPWWTIFIAWSTVTLTSLVASFFVMLYGLKYGYVESLKWLVSFLTAFVDDAFVMEPLKVAGMAVILTFLLKRPAELSESPAVIDQSKIDDIQNERSITNDQKAKIMKVSNETVEKSRLEHNLNSKVKRKINNLIVNVFFIVIILCVVHNHHSVENCFRQACVIENQYAGTQFKEIKSSDEIWFYLKTVFMDTLGRTLRYEQEKRLVENDFLLMGKFRLRQIRVERDNCVFPSQIMRMFTLNINCSSSLSLLNFDTSNYDKSWNPILSTNSEKETDEWTYHSAWDLQATPIVGHRAFYNGGGYVIELKPEIPDYTLIDMLYKNNWIDNRSKGVFIEFTLYNPSMNLFSSVVLIIEFDNPGQPILSHQITTSELYNYSNEKHLEKLITDILFVLLTLLFTYVQIKKANQVGIKTYFKGFWNILSMFQMLLCFLVISVYSVRIMSTESVLELFRKEGYDRYLNFSLAILWDSITVYIMAILLAVSTIKLIKLFTLNANLKYIVSVGSYAKNPMKHFAFMFIICLLSFVCAGNLLFGHLVRDFKTIGDSFMSLVSFTVSIRNFHQLLETSPFIGPIFLFLYMFMFVFCFMKLFTVIVMNSFRHLRREGIVETGQTSLLFHYFSKSIKKLLR